MIVGSRQRSGGSRTMMVSLSMPFAIAGGEPISCKRVICLSNLSCAVTRDS